MLIICESVVITFNISLKHDPYGYFSENNQSGFRDLLRVMATDSQMIIMSALSLQLNSMEIRLSIGPLAMATSM